MAVLDVMLPDGDGFGLFKKIRSDRTFPCCFSPQEERRKINFWAGLGADDYIVKPFLPKELTLRIGVILRRCYKEEQPVVRLADAALILNGPR